MAENTGFIAMTVRISKEIYEVVSSISERHGISKAEAVRLAIDNRLLDYVGKVQYVDPDQGVEIMKLIGRVATEMSKIRMEINRIGVNYNQELKLKHLEKKYMHRTDLISIEQKMKELDKITNDIDTVSEEGLMKLLDKCDSIMDKFGDVTCILG